MAAEAPPMVIAVREREGCSVLEFAKGTCTDTGFSDIGTDDMVYDAVGTSFATYNRKKAIVTVFDAATSKAKFTVEAEKVMGMALSPKGGWLAVWRAPEMEGRKENLFIYKTAEQTLASHTWAPTWPCISWSPCENTTVTYDPFQGINCYNDVSLEPILKVPGKWTHVNLSPTSPTSIIAISIPSEKERDTVPTVIKVFRPPKDKALLEYQIKIDSVSTNWNKKGTAVLVDAQLDSDQSGKSYYGEATLLLFQVQTKKTIPINTGKTPIHDVQWNNNGKEFIVIYGKMPDNEAVLYDEKGTLLHKFAIAPRNTVCWSPHNRFFMLSGFGNLPGDVVVYDREKLSASNTSAGVIGKFNMSSVTKYGFSPCSRYIMCSTCHPRMTTANKLVIFKHNGEKCFEQKYNELYDVIWRPLSSRFFEMRDPSPASLSPTAAKPAPKAAAFRAAGRDRGLAGSIKTQLSATTSGKSATQHTSNKVGSSFTNWGQEEKKKVEKNTVVGAEPACVGLEAPVVKEKKVKKEVEVAQDPVEDFAAKSYPEIEKALRAAKKKVQACGQLKGKDVATLQPDQKKKLAGFTNFKAEAAYLEKLHKAGVTSQ
eukprot:TRINITY_DN30869_c0_g1_i1.p1 TRINITY_DN30869_c0_g1~~TRINITY_DN30869_c0_g1_i1.p1  ORF type:complete len:596 (+),score=159.10 TRINITY_DN30869_c0_g1_i1:37-1824(+)